MSTRRSHAAPQGIARHGQLPTPHPVRKMLGFVGVTVAVLAVSATSIAAVATARIADNVSQAVVDINIGEEGAPPPSLSDLKGGLNLLIVGTDNDANQSTASFGERDGATLNDVNMLLHVSEDQSNAVLVSFPRDLIVPIPSCRRTDGSSSYAMTAQPLNVAWYYGGKEGGLNCVHKTIETLTGLEIPYAASISFNGVINMSTAVGGVDVCVSRDINDPYTGLHLTAGRHTIAGAEALGYLRTRHGLSDGSDLARISNQQSFLSSLIRTVKSDDTLTDLTKLYGLAWTATDNMQLSGGLANADTMVSMARILTKLDVDKIALVQYPGTTGSVEHPGKVIPLKRDADALFSLIKADTPVVPGEGNTGNGTIVDPDAPTQAPVEPTDPAVEAPTELPTSVTGQRASDYTCSK